MALAIRMACLGQKSLWRQDWWLWRILWTAMTSDGTYQPSLTPEKAYDEILQGTGKLYDPDVVDVLQAAWPGIATRMSQMDQDVPASANIL